MQTEQEEAYWLTCAETAKLVRAALKREFGGQKFSVRSSTYSGGASIDVRWTDGPTQGEVQRVTGVYAGGRFDGMIDLAYSAEHWLFPDGTAEVRREYGHSFSEVQVHENDLDDHRARKAGARLVHFGADHVFCERDLSPEFKANCAFELRKFWGSEERAVEQTHEDLSTLVWRESQRWAWRPAGTWEEVER